MERKHHQDKTIDQEGLMGDRRNSIQVLAVVVLGMVMIAGCSGHSVRYGANSEGDGESALPGSSEETALLNSGSAHGSDGQGHYYGGGTVNGRKPYSGTAAQSSAVNDPSAQGSSETAMDSSANGGKSDSNFSGTDYGQNYSGISGSGPNHGGVSGFGQGSANGANPDPEAWANAYLRGGNSSQEFYGDPSNMSQTADGSSASDTTSASVNPNTWADSYVKENGGPSPEYVNPDMQVARVQERGSEVVKKTHLKATKGFDGQGGTLQDIYFDFDSWAISRQGAQDLEQGAQWLKNNPGEMLTIEGHCDQRGTQDYNLVLGKKRAEAAREYLEKLGVDAQRIKIVSYGKERPFCQKDSEDCFQENRRSHMVIHLN
ncbi:MAG: OmpA family protein [Nitrospirales bacterium]|nr:OmpA family protein [Nitrospirales bacterium]